MRCVFTVSLISVLRHFDFKWQTILEINASDYVKDKILSQYDYENVFHLIVFYSKSMILAECNYHICDKKLLVIIWCFKHWRLKLECTELLIQIFINYQTLKIFIDWSRWVESSRSSRVFNSSRLDSSQNFETEYLSQVTMFELSI